MSTSVWNPDIQAALEQARASFDEAREGARDLDRTRGFETSRPFPSPGDWRDKWIYQVLVDRFNNPALPPHRPWDSEYFGFQGGTLEGVRQQLDYLQDLGVGALWLSPLLKNPQQSDAGYHGYGIQDFLHIDPRLASDPQAAHQNPSLVEAELQALIDEAHRRGIYIIFDIVLNHAGDVFEYADHGSEAPWSDTPYPIHWRDETGRGRPDWTEAPANPPADAAVWPTELRRNQYFRRQGVGGEAGGDFASLKELVTELHELTAERGDYYAVRDTLIRVHQYLIAKYDIDGFRVDTLKYIEPQFARIFGDAIREYALSIGKTNFFTFGEVYDTEEKIAGYVGRNTATEEDDLVGVDAALDFPLFYKLPKLAKGQLAPSEIIQMFAHRREVQRHILSSHGEASRFFVTFLDNHDQFSRFHYSEPGAPHRFDNQLIIGVGCLFMLQGIPCLYYGTEQGLHGAGGSLEAVREALWGKPNAFDRAHPFYQAIQRLAAIRSSQPAARYGRQYFRPIAGDGVHFGISPFREGVLAFSRLLQDQEVVVVANTSTQSTWNGEVIVDFAINALDRSYELLFSNNGEPAGALPRAVADKAGGSVEIHEESGAVTHGPARVLPVRLQPMEIQIWGKTR